MAEQSTETVGRPPKAKAAYKRKRVIFPLLLLLILAGAVILYWDLFLRGYVSTDDAFIDADPTTVSSKIVGRVTELTLDVGDSVTQGQMLVHLDDSDLKAQEAQANAALEYARQNVTVTRIGVERAQEDFNRASYQFKDNVITHEQIDHSRKALELAQAQCNVAQSQVNTSQAQLEVIQTQLRNTRIESPLSGIVAKKWVMLGDIVQVGQPILTLYDLNDLWVTAYFEETKLASIRPGDSVGVSVDAYPDRIFAAKVALIAPAAASQFSLIPPNNASGNFTKVTQRIPVKILMDGTRSDDLRGRAALFPGMSVEVKIRVKEQ
jgi:membrane fusion protein (multidrug efflux system)